MNGQGEQDNTQGYWQPQQPAPPADPNTPTTSSRESIQAPLAQQAITAATTAPEPPVVSRYAGYELTEAVVQNQSSQLTVSGDGDVVSWRASEYVHHEKSMTWFVFLGVGAFVLAGLALIFAQWTFALLIVVMAVVIGVFGKRPPRELRYQVGPSGIDVESNHYEYANFRAFGVVQDGALFSVVLLPSKRFALSISMYFSESDGEQIFDVLAAHLPHEDIEPDMIERLTRRLRF